MMRFCINCGREVRRGKFHPVGDPYPYVYVHVHSSRAACDQGSDGHITFAKPEDTEYEDI